MTEKKRFSAGREPAADQTEERQVHWEEKL